MRKTLSILRSSTIVVCFSLVLVFVSSLQVVQAQSTYGTIRGIVRDQSGAVIPGVEVTARNTDGNFSRSTTSDDTGNYEFQNVVAGHYEITASLPGFKKTVRSDISLGARDVVRIDLTLEVGEVSQQILVSGEAPVIATETATISAIKTTRELQQLPLNFRGANSSPIALVSFLPGVQVDSGSAITVAGNHIAQNEFTIDGISTTSVRSNGPVRNLFPSIEGISEMRVSSTNNNAEFPEQGDITTVSRGGTNQFHGSIFEYHQNKSLNARDYFVPIDPVTGKKPFLLGNTFGGSLGGPVLKDRVFFFGDFEAVRFQNARPWVITVPTAALRAGDFTGVGTVKDPLTGQPFDGNKILGSRISPVSQKILEKFYPQPNSPSGAIPANNFRRAGPQSFNSNQFDIRGDYVISSRHSMFGRFTFKNLSPLSSNSLPVLGNDPNFNKTRGFTFSDSWSLSPRLLNEFRFGVTRSNQLFGVNIDGISLVKELGLQSLPAELPAGGGLPEINISGFVSVSHSRDESLRELRLQYADNMTWIVGRHTMKWGFDIRPMSIQDAAIFTVGDDFGTFDFDGSFTGHPFGDFLLGIPASSTIADTGPDFDSAVRHYGFFWQDDFKVSPRFTLNFGVRYEYHPPFHDRTLQLTNFDRRNAKVVVPNEVSKKLAVPGFVASIPNTPIVTAAEDHIPETLRFPDKNNFAPRFGFAFRPFGNERSVLRGGFGVYTVTILGSVLYSLIGIHTADVRAYNNALVGGKPLFQFPLARAGAEAISPVGTQDFRTANDIFYRDPYSMQWNLTWEQEITKDTAVHISYTGSKTLKLTVSPDLNAVLPQAKPYDHKQVPFPDWNIIFSRDNGGMSWYNALALQLRKRYSRGLTFDSSYYWSKNLSWAEGPVPGSFAAENGPRIVDSRFLRLDYGDVSFTHRHRFLTTALWELPFGRGRAYGSNLNPFLNAVAGGWEVSGILLLQTGPYITPRLGSGRDPSGTNQQNRVGHRPDRVGNGNLPSGQRTIARWFDTSAFVDPPSNIGRYGNAGVGILIGPGTEVVSVGVSKAFNITEQMKLRFQSTFQNLFNHPNFGVPGNRVRTGSFGKISSLQTAEGAGPRTIQLALRIDF